MYKVFLVDDEIIIREGIRNSIEWDKTKFIFSGEAANGKKALSLVKDINPDIIVTDIKMPFMDGLELSKKIKVDMPWIKIIILSGYDDFNYAKQAIHIGVDEYLLKPVGPKELLESLDKVSKQIDKEKQVHNIISNMKNQINETTSIIKEKFLNELVLGVSSYANILEKCRLYNINLDYKYYSVQIIEIDSNKSNYTYDVNFESYILEIVQNLHDIISFKRIPEQYILIFRGNSIQVIEDKLYGCAHMLKKKFQQNENISAVIAIGNVYENIDGIKKSYKEATMALKYKYVNSKNKIIYFKDIKVDNYENIIDIENLSKINLLEFFKYGVRSDVDTFIEKYIDSLNIASIQSVLYLHHVLMNIVQSSLNFLLDRNVNYKDIIPEVENLEMYLKGLDSVDSFRKLSKNILIKVLKSRDLEVESKYSDVINKAKTFIHKNYSDNSISLKTLSACVNMSTSYFSTIFSQELGMTFIEYLTSIRIEKAKELLKNTSLRSSEISYRVGYSNTHYFSYIFRKIVKMSPTEFRRNSK